MVALVTGASSGIGRDMAKELYNRGYNLILVARNGERLQQLKEELGNKKEIKIISMDLSEEENVLEVYEKVRKEEIDVFINNAGFGEAGNFLEINLENELNMIKVNDVAMHILFKLLLRDMQKRGKGYILNVSSLAGFMPGPYMATYYATKAYMLNLTRAVYKELKMEKSLVSVSVLCPGPIQTNFEKRAKVIFKTPLLSSPYTAKYAIDQMFKRKLVIIPGFFNQVAHVLNHIVPAKVSMSVTSRIQERG